MVQLFPSYFFVFVFFYLFSGLFCRKSNITVSGKEIHGILQSLFPSVACDYSSSTGKCVVQQQNSKNQLEGFISIEKFLEKFPLDFLVCLIEQNFLQYRSNLPEKNLATGFYVTPVNPVYDTVFAKIVAQSFVGLQNVIFTEKEQTKTNL